MFRDINKKKTAKRALQNLKQQDVATAYATEF
jgi:hypothetical protein